MGAGEGGEKGVCEGKRAGGGGYMHVGGEVHRHAILHTPPCIQHAGGARTCGKQMGHASKWGSEYECKCDCD